MCLLSLIVQFGAWFWSWKGLHSQTGIIWLVLSLLEFVGVDDRWPRRYSIISRSLSINFWQPWKKNRQEFGHIHLGLEILNLYESIQRPNNGNIHMVVPVNASLLHYLGKPTPLRLLHSQKLNNIQHTTHQTHCQQTTLRCPNSSKWAAISTLTPTTRHLHKFPSPTMKKRATTSTSPLQKWLYSPLTTPIPPGLYFNHPIASAMEIVGVSGQSRSPA